MIQVLSTQEAIVATIESDVADLINRSSLSYYNTSKFLPTTVADKKLLQRILQRSPLKVDDKTFDDLVDWLREKNPRHPVLKKIGAPVQVKQKVELPVPMSSLDKKKPNTGEVDTWCQRNPGPYIVSDKEDGTSILLEYRGGSLKCYTRGNGTIGQDISYLAPHFKVPQKLTGTWIIRGEVIMSKASFGNWSHAYENARNLASGMVNTKGVHEALKDVDVIVYSVLSPRGVPSAQLAKLKTLGFKVVPFRVFDTLSDSVLTSALMARKKASKYEIDGIVVDVDKKTNLPTFGANPKTSFAFKTASQGDEAQTTVVKVHWALTKNGLIKPRVEIEPVKLDGVTVTFATGYNAKYIVDNKIGPGAVIRLIRSGGVIPKIEQVIKGTRAQLPRGIKYEWNDTEVDIMATDEGHAEQETKRITSFFLNIGVDGIGLGNIVKMYDAGYNTIDKILRMKVADYLKIPGFQQRTAEKLYTNIKEACTDAWLPSVADGSGLFGSNFGTKRLELIYDEYPDFTYLSTLNPKLLQTKIESIRGFSSTMASQFVQGIKPFMDWVKKQPITFAEQEEVELLSNKLQGQRICMTGFRDADLVLEIEANGGENVPSVNAKTTILLVSTKTGNESSKFSRAKKLGIKILTVGEFKKTYSL